MFLDIDHFKSINDQYGHPFGDEVLHALAEVLKGSMRQNDFSCRYGGEEFVVLIPSNGVYGIQIANRILENTRTIAFPDFPDFVFTVSIGLIAKVPGDAENLADYIKYADTALYEAKQSGRNKLVIYEDAMGVKK